MSEWGHKRPSNSGPGRPFVRCAPIATAFATAKKERPPRGGLCEAQLRAGRLGGVGQLLQRLLCMRRPCAARHALNAVRTGKGHSRTRIQCRVQYRVRDFMVQAPWLPLFYVANLPLSWFGTMAEPGHTRGLRRNKVLYSATLMV